MWATSTTAAPPLSTRGDLSDEHLLPPPRKSTYWGEPGAGGEARRGMRRESRRRRSRAASATTTSTPSSTSVSRCARGGAGSRGASPGAACSRPPRADSAAPVRRTLQRLRQPSCTREAERVGGAHYAQLVALAYRQAIAACKLVAAPDGRPFFFSKENFSNACMGTVDVNYKSAPLFLYANPVADARHARPDLRLLPQRRLDHTRSPRTTSASTPRPTGRSTATFTGRRRKEWRRCRSRSAATC